MNFWKMFFQFCFFFADDPTDGGSDPNGQQGDKGDGNGDGGDGDGSNSPTEFVEVNGVQIPTEQFDALAKERHKDAFDAKENRDKWQAENTKKAQEIADIRRKADSFDRLEADRFRQVQAPPTNLKDQYVQDMSKRYKDIDPTFLEGQFDWMQKMASMQTQQAINPIITQQNEDFERKFLADHPNVVVNSPEYQRLSSLIGAGADADDAYHLVFPNDRIESAIKARDDETKRKLKQSPTRGKVGVRQAGSHPDDRAKAIIDEMYDT